MCTLCMLLRRLVSLVRQNYIVGPVLFLLYVADISAAHCDFHFLCSTQNNYPLSYLLFTYSNASSSYFSAKCHLLVVDLFISTLALLCFCVATIGE